MNKGEEIHKKTLEQDGIIYLLNDEEKTAGIVECKLKNQDLIIIPRCISQESKEYTITSILERSFRRSTVKSIKFAQDSKLQTIEEAFARSLIESLEIPSEVRELKGEWCMNAFNLKELIIHPSNPYFKSYDGGKLILKKSSLEQPIYDCIVFCSRNAKTVIIPNFIEQICTCTFEGCGKLHQVEFQNDSKLKKIGDYAFYLSSIKKIKIPSSVTEIGESAFAYCYNLERIEIPDDSQLQTIYGEIFNDASITCFTIPSQVININRHAFARCEKLQIVEINENSKLDLIYSFMFRYSENVMLMVPVNLSISIDF